MIQFAVERVAGHGSAVAHDKEFHAGSCDGDVHAAQIAQEAYLPFVVVAHEADDDYVAFLTLKTINCVDADEVLEWLEISTLAQQAP